MCCIPFVRSIAPWICVVLCCFCAPSTLAQEGAPVDAYGRPVADELGPVEYRQTETGWIAIHADGSETAASPMPTTSPEIPAADLALPGYRLGPYSYFPIGSRPSSVAIGDITGDGRADVTLMTSFYFDPVTDYMLFVFPQLPDGTLGAPAKYPYYATVSGDYGLILADLDENGVLDVVAGHNTGITVLLSDGAGGLRPGVVVPGANSHNLAAIDANRDGYMDIASLSWRDGLTILLGDGHGALQGTPPIATNAFQFNDLEANDLNADGITDLAVAAGGGTPWQLTVHLHDGFGGFVPPDAYTAGSELPRGVGVGDIDGDGRNDAVVAHPANVPTWLWIWKQNETGRLTGPVQVSSFHLPESVEIADMDGDGRDDIVVGHAGWQRVGIYFQRPDGVLSPEILYPTPFVSAYSGHQMKVGDFTSDGCPDVAIAATTFGLIVLHGEGCTIPCVPADCDDGNPCTDDACDPASGCVHTNNHAVCDDGNMCTHFDTCADGACVGAQPVSCVALDACHTAGACDPSSGLCSNPTVLDGTACDDHSLCTTGETCQAGTCTPAHDHFSEPNPRTNGYYKRLCHGPHSGDRLTDADAVCVASIARAFAGMSTVADLCDEIQPSGPNGNACDRTDDDLVVLALNLCRARACVAQRIDSRCGDNANVGQSLAEADAILANSDRSADSCAQAKCLCEEINTGRALELNTLTLQRVGNAVRLQWRAPYLDDGDGLPAGYEVWQRTEFAAPWSKIGDTSELFFVVEFPEAADSQYEVTPWH